MSNLSFNHLIKGRISRPLRIALYGVDGIGKSSWAAGAPAPIFISTEDGTAHLDITRFPAPSGWSEVLEMIGLLYTEKHDFQTVVLDSADWCEQIIRDAICAENNADSIERLGYGKGWVMVQERFSQLLRGFDALYAKGMNVIVIAHSEVKTFNNPEGEPYDRYTIKLSKKAEPLLREWADYVLFANWDTTVTPGQTDIKGNPLMGASGKAKAKSYGKRLLHSQRAAAFDAKQRYAIPVRLPLEWEAFYTAHQSAARLPSTPLNETSN